jgi:GNAT superfamily N-acetyltransferase
VQQKEVYIIRQLTVADVTAYKAIRLEALQQEPGMFGNSYALESGYTDQHWLDRVSNPNGAIFGLYHTTELIGITAIIIDGEHPEEAYMTQSYIRKTHRGKGLSQLLYKARLEWARERELGRLLIGHRESNLISKAANQRHGFKYAYSAPRTWPDGCTEDMLYYTLEL